MKWYSLKVKKVDDIYERLAELILIDDYEGVFLTKMRDFMDSDISCG